MIGTVSWLGLKVGRRISHALEGFPDHGVPAPHAMKGGAYIHTRLQYYADTAIKDFRSTDPELAGRDILDSIGYGQKYSNEIIGKVHKIGNNLGLPGPALEDTLQGVEEDVKEDTGIDVRYPMDVKGAEVLLVTPSADFFAEPHIDSLIGYGKVFHAAGISWTLSSYASEAGNFGLFNGDYNMMRKVAMRIREQRAIAVVLDARVIDLEQAGIRDLDLFAQMGPQMPLFKRLMDIAGPSDLTALCTEYQGLGRYATLLEMVAAGIQSGAIDVPR
jgi:hypothetical protein